MQIHYEALPAECIGDEMRNFLGFINKSSENAYVKSALTHIWFAIIHTYEGGKDYYEILKQTTKLENNLNFDFTAWIKWHLEAVNSAIKQAIRSLKR